MGSSSSSSSSSSSPKVGPWHDLSVSLAILLRVLLQQDADLASLTPQLVQIRRELVEDFEENSAVYQCLAHSLLECDGILTTKPKFLELLKEFKELMSCVKYRLHVQEPFFTQLKDGSKTVEGRCSIGAYNSLEPGDIILFNDTLTRIVKVVIHYSSFEEMLESEGLDAVLPGINSVAEGVLIYRQFYSEEKESLQGIIGIHVLSPPEEKQPLAIVGSMLQTIGLNDLKTLILSTAAIVPST